MAFFGGNLIQIVVVYVIKNGIDPNWNVENVKEDIYNVRYP